MGRTSDITESYERQVRTALRPLSVSIARARILDVLGWWQLRQHYSRAQLVASGIVTRATSYRQEGHFEELVGKPVSEVSRQELDAWTKSLAVFRSEVEQ